MKFRKIETMTDDEIRRLIDDMQAGIDALEKENHALQNALAEETEGRLKRIEWMLNSDDACLMQSGEDGAPEYGDLTELNTNRVILDSLGKKVLTDIVGDFLQLLGTSAAVYESNGDYALGIFSSKWCRFMDASSRRRCNTGDDREALASGKWLCHESCREAWKACMESGEPVDMACAGGIRIYAAPIYGNGDIIGSINMGYGDPPREPGALQHLSEKYGVAVHKLLENAEAYESRPPFIVEIAKNRLLAAARLIGEIVARKKTESALRESEETYRMLVENLNEVIYTLDENARITYISKTVESVAGYTPSELTGKKYTDFVHPDDRDRLFVNFKVDSPGIEKPVEYRLFTKDNRIVWVRTVARPLFEEGHVTGVQGVLSDITQWKKSELERDKLQAQLHQAQKMESVGRLAGGVAHDFNNMLTIINGYAEMMTDLLEPSDPMYDSAREIHDAGQRSAVIVRKLLAFARKQVISPVPMNLNDSVSSMMKMLEKLIGENIDLLWKPGQNLWLVNMDYSQVDQIVANLVVNARDAIADIGKITIETKNVAFDEEYCLSHAGFVPGQFVMLAVSDNGCGMDKHTLDKLFEPFFTTKELGKGTGLGMPTVYGIVKQNNGFVNVYSEPGQGTTVRVYLPRLLEDACGAHEKEQKEPLLHGRGEIVMVLEDESTVLNIACIMLEKLGYKVLAASSASEAMTLTETHGGKIDLLLTDIVMPEMNGLDFAAQLKSCYPDIKTLYMSGYTADVIARHGMLGEGVQFIQKPFSIQELAKKVREAIEA